MITKQTLVWISSLILVFSLGIYIDRCLLTPSEVIKQETLQEIDQKFMEKARKGLLPVLIPVGENHSKKVSSFSGEIIEISPQNNLLKLKVPNIYRGGNITKFLYQPDYFIKEILVDENTKIVKVEIEINESNSAPVFKEIPLSLSDLKIGQTISVETRMPILLEKDTQVIAKIIKTR